MSKKTDWKKLLEEELNKKSSPPLTYAAWETKRKVDWKDVLRKNRPELTIKTSNETSFYDQLSSVKVFNNRTIESFKQQKGRCAQISAVLDALNRRPFEDFLSFCQSLADSEQFHIITNCLTPEIESVGEDATDAVIATRSVHASSSVQTSSTPPPSFDWRKQMRDHLVPLSHLIDPDNGLLRELHSRGVISDWAIDTFQDPKGKTHRVTRILDHIMMKRPTEDFVKFCDALKDTNQAHVVTRYLTYGQDNTDLGSDDFRQLEHSKTLGIAELNENLVTNWKEIIIQHRNQLVEEMEPSDEVLNELLKYGVMNVAVFEVLKEETNRYARAEHLLDHMRRRSDNDFAKFRFVLKKCNQEHVVKEWLGSPVQQRTENVAVAESSEQEAYSTYSAAGDQHKADLENLPKHSQQQSAVVNEEEDEACRMCVDDDEWRRRQNRPIGQEVSEASDNNRPVLVPSVVTRNMMFNQTAAAAALVSSDTIRDADINAAYALDGGERGVDHPQRQPQPENTPVYVQQLEAFTLLEAGSGPTRIDRIDVQCSGIEFYNVMHKNAYAMSKNPRGRCYIFNIETIPNMPRRQGTRVDGSNIRCLFEQLYFTVHEYHNPTSDDMKRLILQISQDPSLMQDQCLVLFILSHGTTKIVDGKKKDVIFGSDGYFLTPEELMVPLTDRYCRYLKDKPRLVFFQACRGEKLDATDSEFDSPGESSVVTTTTDFTPDEAPSYADFLIGYPTQSSYRSFRNTEYGSWYINALIKVFMHYAHSTGVCSMLNILNGAVSTWQSNTGRAETTNKTQIANYVSNFRKADLFFFPGIAF